MEEENKTQEADPVQAKEGNLRLQRLLEQVAFYARPEGRKIAWQKTQEAGKRFQAWLSKPSEPLLLPAPKPEEPNQKANEEAYGQPSKNVKPYITHAEAIKDSFLAGTIIGAVAITLATYYQIAPLIIWSCWFTVVAALGSVAAKWQKRNVFYFCLALATICLIVASLWQGYILKRSTTEQSVKAEQSVSPSPNSTAGTQTTPTPFSQENQIARRLMPPGLIKTTPESTGNSFSDFRVFHEDKRRILFDVWYQYNGSAGREDIWIDARLLDKDGILLPVTTGCDYIEAKVVGTKTIAKMDCSFTPSPGFVGQSTQIEICMRRGLGNEYITCTRFPYKKKLE